MDILKIPFIELLNIKRDNSTLIIEPIKSLENHLGTMHAGAIYTLAETQSGLYLQNIFKDLSNSAIPILRSSTIKYKKEINSKVEARANAKLEDLERFFDIFIKKGRAIISVDVDIVDRDNILYAVASFNWFVQKISIIK